MTSKIRGKSIRRSRLRHPVDSTRYRRPQTSGGQWRAQRDGDAVRGDAASADRGSRGARDRRRVELLTRNSVQGSRWGATITPCAEVVLRASVDAAVRLDGKSEPVCGDLWRAQQWQSFAVPCGESSRRPDRFRLGRIGRRSSLLQNFICAQRVNLLRFRAWDIIDA